MLRMDSDFGLLGALFTPFLSCKDCDRAGKPADFSRRQTELVETATDVWALQETTIPYRQKLTGKKRDPKMRLRACREAVSGLVTCDQTRSFGDRRFESNTHKQMNSMREELDKDLLKNLQIIDAALGELKTHPILVNKDFDVAKVHDGYLRATLKPSPSRIPFVIEVASQEIQIHIDRINEARWWDKEHLKDRQREIQQRYPDPVGKFTPCYA
jgi:hypothetical protein